MKTIEIKKDNKTTYKIVPDDYKPDDTEDIAQGDLTTGTAKHVAIGISKERHSEIFGKEQ